MNIQTIQLSDFVPRPSAGFAQWLNDVDVALLVSHTNKLISIGRHPNGDLRIDHTAVYALRCLAAREVKLEDGESVASLSIVSGSALIDMYNGLGPGELSERGADRNYFVRNTRFLGGVVASDLGHEVLADGTCSEVFASVAYSVVCSPDPLSSIKVRWRPPWITEVVDQTRCRLTGIGFRDGTARTVSAASTADVVDGWEAHQRDGGLLVDMATNEVLAQGMSLPHSPRFHQGRWWIVQAGTGEIGYVEQGVFNSVCRLDGFLRGMAIVGRFAVIGASGSRWNEILDGLPVGERVSQSGAPPAQGIYVLDTDSGEIVASLRLDGTAREIGDVVALPGVRVAHIDGADGRAAQESVTVEVGWQRKPPSPPLRGIQGRPN